MTDLAIRVENLSKQYRIGGREKRANTLRERLANLAASPFDYLRRTLRGPTEEETIWALKDVSFEVKRGGQEPRQGDKGMGRQGARQVFSLSPPLPLSLSQNGWAPASTPPPSVPPRQGEDRAGEHLPERRHV